MNKKDIAIYLYTIQKTNKSSPFLLDTLFHFYRFLALSKKETWEKFFSIQNYCLSEPSHAPIMQMLSFYKLVEPSGLLTPKGEAYLEQFLCQHTDLHQALDDFFAQYNGEPATLSSCFKSNQNQGFLCHLCTQYDCLKKTRTARDHFSFKPKAYYL